MNDEMSCMLCHHALCLVKSMARLDRAVAACMRCPPEDICKLWSRFGQCRHDCMLEGVDALVAAVLLSGCTAAMPLKSRLIVVWILHKDHAMYADQHLPAHAPRHQQGAPADCRLHAG